MKTAVWPAVPVGVLFLIALSSVPVVSLLLFPAWFLEEQEDEGWHRK